MYSTLGVLLATTIASCNLVFEKVCIDGYEYLVTPSGNVTQLLKLAPNSNPNEPPTVEPVPCTKGDTCNEPDFGRCRRSRKVNSSKNASKNASKL